jgi:nitrogen fixation NifU-like protein
MPEPLDGPMTDEQQLYKENILDHYKHPRNKRATPHCTVSVTETNPLCGDKISAYLTVNDGTITEVTFEGSGCAISQAAMSMLTEELKAKKTADVLGMSKEDVLKLLGIPIGPVRMKCAMLGLRTTQRALGGTA